MTDIEVIESGLKLRIDNKDLSRALLVIQCARDD